MICLETLKSTHVDVGVFIKFPTVSKLYWNAVLEMDSGDDIFLTQNSFTQITESKGGYDTDNLLNDVLEMEEATQNRPNFQLKIDKIKDFSDDDLIQATLDVEENERKSRFSKPLTEKAMNDLVNGAAPKNTQRKSLWAFNLLNLWLKERKITENVFTMSNDKLCDVLGRFITEVKTQNGSDYPPNTLYEIIVSIQHYMRQNGKFISLLDDNEFAKLRQILDAKMKALAKTDLSAWGGCGFVVYIRRFIYKFLNVCPFD